MHLRPPAFGLAFLPTALPSRGQSTRAREMLSPRSSAWDIGVRKGGHRQANIRVVILGELKAPELPRLQTAISEAGTYGEKSLSGPVPRERTAAEEIASLLAVLREAAGCLNQWRCSTFGGRAEARPNRHAGQRDAAGAADLAFRTTASAQVRSA